MHPEPRTRTHRHKEPRSRATALVYLAPVGLLVVAVAAVLLGRAFLGSSPKPDTAQLASAPLPRASSTATPTPTAATPTATAAPVSAAVAPSAVKNLGIAKGVFTLKGPAKVSKGSYVVFVLDGKKRVLKTDATAPYAVKVHTTALPNGPYTVSVLVTSKGKVSVVTTGTLTVRNVKASPKPTVTPVAGDPSITSAVLSLTNTERAKAGCPALTSNADLTQAAQGHSADMAANNYFDHNSQNGASPFDRMKDAGYSFSAAAENIAEGQQTAAAVMSAWMNSPGHKANILNCGYTQIGIGYAKDKSGAPYWTQDFGTPQ